MQSLNDITVRVVEGDQPGSVPDSVTAVLHEITRHLEALASKGESSVIDLASLLPENERRLLQDFLGEGEVSVSLDVLGHSTLYETRFPGVWWISHFNADGNPLSETVEITTVPAILHADTVDIHEALRRLGDEILPIAQTDHMVEADNE